MDIDYDYIVVPGKRMYNKYMANNDLKAYDNQ